MQRPSVVRCPPASSHFQLLKLSHSDFQTPPLSPELRQHLPLNRCKDE